MDWQWLAVAGVAALGGLMRGLTGFGGAMVMTPMLSLAYAPRRVVPSVMLLEAFIAAPMLVPALRAAQRRVVLAICLAAVATLPFGAFVLLHTPAQALQHAPALRRAADAIAAILLPAGGSETPGARRRKAAKAA